MRNRASDNEAEILRHMATAVAEISHVHEFDDVLVNTALKVAVNQALAVLTASRLVLARQASRDSFTTRLCAKARCLIARCLIVHEGR